jgi:hypothetical protein
MTERVRIAKTALRRRHEHAVPGELIEKLTKLPGAFGQGRLDQQTDSLDVKALEGHRGL